MIRFDGWSVPPDFRNDGCTCAPDRWFGIDLRPACEMHDFHARHLVHDRYMTVQQADWIFRRHLIALGLPPLVARLYWLAVKLARPWRRDRAPLLLRWLAYAQRDVNPEQRQDEIVRRTATEGISNAG